MDLSIHGGVHIYAPDLATRSSYVDPRASAQTYYARADFINTELRALVCSIYPRSTLHCTQRKLVCCSPALLGGFGISPVASTPQIRVETPPCRAALLHLSWRGHQTCTPQDVNMQAQLGGWELLRASQLLSRKDGGPCGEEIIVLGI